MENLLHKIEFLRKRMHATAFKKGLSHPNVLLISQILDKAINEFFNQKIGYINNSSEVHYDTKLTSNPQLHQRLPSLVPTYPPRNRCRRRV